MCRREVWVAALNLIDRGSLALTYSKPQFLDGSNFREDIRKSPEPDVRTVVLWHSEQDRFGRFWDLDSGTVTPPKARGSSAPLALRLSRLPPPTGPFVLSESLPSLPSESLPSQRTSESPYANFHDPETYYSPSSIRWPPDLTLTVRALALARPGNPAPLGAAFGRTAVTTGAAESVFTGRRRLRLGRLCRALYPPTDAGCAFCFVQRLENEASKSFCSFRQTDGQFNVGPSLPQKGVRDEFRASTPQGGFQDHRLITKGLVSERSRQPSLPRCCSRI
jgi:hypothetical protein